MGALLKVRGAFLCLFGAASYSGAAWKWHGAGSLDVNVGLSALFSLHDCRFLGCLYAGKSMSDLWILPAIFMPSRYFVPNQSKKVMCVYKRNCTFKIPYLPCYPKRAI